MINYSHAQFLKLAAKALVSGKEKHWLAVWQHKIDLYPNQEPDMVNIFVTNRGAKYAAQDLTDHLVPRMCMEVAQILCGVHWSLIYPGEPTPKKHGKYDPPWDRTLGQRKHPACIWAGKNIANYIWTLTYFEELAAEYKVRYPNGKDELGAYFDCHTYFHRYKKRLPQGGFNFDSKDIFEFAFFSEYTDIKALNIPVTGRYKLLMAYKYLYVHKKTPTWTNRDVPVWLHDERIHRWLRKTYGKPIRSI